MLLGAVQLGHLRVPWQHRHLRFSGSRCHWGQASTLQHFQGLRNNRGLIKPLHWRLDMEKCALQFPSAGQAGWELGALSLPHGCPRHFMSHFGQEASCHMAGNQGSKGYMCWRASTFPRSEENTRHNYILPPSILTPKHLWGTSVESRGEQALLADKDHSLRADEVDEGAFRQPSPWGELCPQKVSHLLLKSSSCK